jgi:carbohydrate-selective porin OprB
LHSALTTVQPGPAVVLAGARQTLNAVVNVPMSAFGDCVRPEDNFGIGYAFSDLAEAGVTGNQFSDGLEHVGEVYYRWKLNDAMSLIPSFQMITNPLGMTKNGVITVWSLRFSTTF